MVNDIISIQYNFKTGNYKTNSLDRMKSYNYESIEQEQKQDYKQELGLRKMLYKYQHENEQLKNQIKALTQRLQSILSQKSQQNPKKGISSNTNNSGNSNNEAHEKYLSDQMNYYYKVIEQLNGEIKYYKQKVDDSKQIQYTNLSNTYKDKQAKLGTLKSKLTKFKQELQNSNTGTTSRVESNNTKANSNQQLQIKYTSQLAELKKRLRQLEKTRNQNNKVNINKHSLMVNLETKTRKISLQQFTNPKTMQENDVNKDGPGKKGLWGLDLTQQNYHKISQEFEVLKKQKNNLLESIKVQNNGLKQKLVKLKNQYIDLSSHAGVNNSVNLSVPKLKQSILMTPKQKVKQTIVLPDIPNSLGNSAYERKNDKNFVPKKVRLIQWNPGTANKGKKTNPGFAWNDQNHKSPITGINIWLDKNLIGIQFIHTLGETIQHLHIQGSGVGQNKKVVPIQYRLNSNDYLQNIVLIISKSNTAGSGPSIIQGIQLYSKNGRKDAFGMKLGTQGTDKFDFKIQNPEKPIYSFGSFVINPTTHLSNISSLGFAVI